MLDPEFKKLKHYSKDYSLSHTGQELAKGYFPDIVLQNNTGNYIIVESENNPKRKPIIGGMVKAAKFLTKEKRGKLVFVISIKEKEEEIISIVNQIKEYYTWIKPLTNLNKIYVIIDKYYCNKKLPLELLGNEFLKSAHKIS